MGIGERVIILNTHLTLAELTFQLKDAQVKTIIGAPETQALLEEISFVDVQPMVKNSIVFHIRSFNSQVT